MKKMTLTRGTELLSLDPEKVERVESSDHGAALLHLEGGNTCLVNESPREVAKAMWDSAAV